MSTQHALELSEALISPAPHVVSRVIQERAVVLDHTRDELRQLNEVGSLLWAQLLKEPTSLNALVTLMLHTFEVERDEAERDAQSFLTELYELKLITLTHP